MARATAEKVTESDPELEACEALISANHKCKNWLKVGTALMFIHDVALFKKAGWRCFLKYADDRKELFGFGGRHALRLLAAAKLVKIFPPTIALPSNEQQVQVLVGQDPRAAIKVWIKANLISQEADIPLTPQLVELVHKKGIPESHKAACEDWRDYMSLDSEFYRTPHHIVAAVKRLFGGAIDLDPCSDELAQVGVQSTRFYTAEDDGLQPGNPWAGRVYVFPPIGVRGNSTLQGLFLDRAIAEYNEGRVTEVVLLLKAAVGYSWFNKVFDHPHCFLADKPLKPQPRPPANWGVPGPYTFAAAYKTAMAALLDLDAGDQPVDVTVKMTTTAAGNEGGRGGGGCGVVRDGRDGGGERGLGGRGGARGGRKSGSKDGGDEQVPPPGDNPAAAGEGPAAGERGRGSTGAGRGGRGRGGRGGAGGRRRSGAKGGEDNPGDNPVAEEEAETAGQASRREGGAASRGRGGKGGTGRRRSSTLKDSDDKTAAQLDGNHPEVEAAAAEPSGGGGDGSGEGGGTRFVGSAGAISLSGRKRRERSSDGNKDNSELKLGPLDSGKRKAAAAALEEPVRRRRTRASWAAEAAAMESDAPGVQAKSAGTVGPDTDGAATDRAVAMEGLAGPSQAPVGAADAAAGATPAEQAALMAAEAVQGLTLRDKRQGSDGHAVGATAMDTAAGTAAGAVGGAAQAEPGPAATGGGAGPGEGPGSSHGAPAAAAVAPAPAEGDAGGGGGQDAAAEAPAAAKEVFNPCSCVVVYIGRNTQRFCEVFSELGYIPGYNSWSLC